MGTPQGSVLSPLLCNIVMHELDVYVEQLRKKFNIGTRRRPNPEYVKLNSKTRYIKEIAARNKMLQDMRKLLASDALDPGFKRLKYVRYADDFVILVIGSKSDAIEIRDRVKQFLQDKCGLSLNIEKTVITNLQTEGFRFLGAECKRADMTKNHVIKRGGNLTVRATTRLRVNIDLRKVYNKLVSTGVAKWDEHNNLVPRGTANNALINFSHADIIAFYNSKMRGLYSYYSFGNRKRLNLVFLILTSSCALTLAKKYKVHNQGAIFKRFGKTLKCPETDLNIFKPETLRTIHDYKTSGAPSGLDFLDVT